MEKKLKWTLPKDLLDKLSRNGNVYFVGGYVRDMLIFGDSDADIDILVTKIEIARLVKILSSYGNAEFVGKSFGVVKFRYGGKTYDFTIPSERTANGGIPKPDMPLEKDLRGRDFTMNAIAFDIRTNEFIDPLGGLHDIENKILKQTSENSFCDDPLRILRLCRFRAQSNFEVEDVTLASAKENIEKLNDVANERIGDEFSKMMLVSHPSDVFECLKNIAALDKLIPELKNCIGVTQPGGMHAYDVFGHILRTIDEAPQNVLIRFAALFHDIAKPQHRFLGDDGRARFYAHQETSAKIAKRWLKKYSFSKTFAENVAKLVKNHMFTHAETDKGVRRFIRRVGEELLEPLFQLRFADTKAQGLGGDMNMEMEYYRRVRKILDEKPPLSVKSLAVDGNDVMRILKIPPSPIVGKVLEELLSKVLDDPSLNEREILLNILNEIVRKNDWRK